MLTTLVIAGALAFLAVPAGAASSIEGIWSFKGGKVAIHPGPEGTFVGTVVEPTKFALCTHSSGEEMWTDMRLQPDGSYWGLHHWFFETAECLPNPKPGPAAWRVMETSSGVHYLMVCFSSPEQPTQPTIASDGEHANVSYGCYGSEVESAHLAALPDQTASPTSSANTKRFTEAVHLPSDRQCFSRRVFQIHLKDPRYDPIKSVVVTLGNRRVAVTRRRDVLAATIDLKGLPRGAFTVEIRVTTVLGLLLSGTRTYHTCASKSKPGSPKPLVSAHRRHGP